MKSEKQNLVLVFTAWKSFLILKKLQLVSTFCVHFFSLYDWSSRIRINASYFIWNVFLFSGYSNFCISVFFPLCQLLLGNFFLIGIHSMQDWTATLRHGVTRKKRSTKRVKHTGNLFKKDLKLKDVC